MIPLILTVTLNPSVDVKYTLNRFLIDEVNRVEQVIKTAGGKGLNVSRVLKQLDADVGATGFLGGELGEFIRSELKKEGIYDWFVPISGKTRNCIAIIHEGQQTEILESGPVIQDEEMDLFLSNFSKLLPQVDLVTISGSLPKGVPDDFYQRIIELCSQHEKFVLLDTNGKQLQQSLQGDAKTNLIKPNEEELANFVGKEIQSQHDLLEALADETLQDIEWIVVSLGAKGAIIKHQESIYEVQIPKVQAVNPVGSGDSVLAGFASGISRNLEGTTLMRYGIAMGVLNAMEEKTGYINPDNIDWCMEQIKVVKLK